MSVISIDALFDEGVGPNLETDYRAALRSADVILGHDWDTQREFLVAGRQYLEDIVASGKVRSPSILRIGLDQDTDDLEKLLAVVQVVRGKHDYQSGEGPSTK